jgi:hypothetical protein
MHHFALLLRIFNPENGMQGHVAPSLRRYNSVGQGCVCKAKFFKIIREITAKALQFPLEG